MKKRRFGKDASNPTREEIEREAARELEQMTRRRPGPQPYDTGGPSFGGGGGGGGTFGGGQSFRPPGEFSTPPMPSVRERFEAHEVEEAGDEDEEYSEEETITELALRDWSEHSRRGRSMEDLALPRLDPGSMEAQRDRALRQFMERQQRMERESAGYQAQRQARGMASPPSPASAVNLTAARPMGMLNLSAQASGMRGQGFAGFGKSEDAEADVPATKAAKAPKKTTGGVRGAKKAAPAKKAPAKKAASAKVVVPKKAAPARKSPPAGGGAATKKAGSARRSAPADKAAPAKKAVAAKRAVPVKKAAPTRKTGNASTKGSSRR